MRVLVIGASGIIGSAVADTVEQAGHDVLRASRRSEVAVDIADPASIRRMYERVGMLDAVISCGGESAFTKLTKLTDEELDFTIRSKLVGQINLVRYGLDKVVDGGAIVLTTGMFSLRPVPGVPAVAMANGGIESFARGAALDLPRGIRIAAISPPFITETAEEMGMSIGGTISAAENAQSYLAFLTGEIEGPVIYPGGMAGA